MNEELLHFDQFSPYPYLPMLYLYYKKSRPHFKFRLNLYNNTEKLELKKVVAPAGHVCFCDMSLASSATLTLPSLYASASAACTPGGPCRPL